MKPTVKLLSATANPIETLYCCWEASRHNAEVLRPAVVAADPELRGKAEALFLQIVEAGIPVAENVQFVFLLEGVSISLREQLVRHRIGTHVGDRLGCDIVPDLADSTWWAQSMRILDMGSFMYEGRYNVPEPVEGNKSRVRALHGQGEVETDVDTLYRHHMLHAQHTYQELVKAGVPMEDAREVIPLGATHRLTWSLNLAALKHIVGKRGCWILQLGLWGPIIEGMINALAQEVHPIFRRLIDPPCFKKGKFEGCTVRLDNTRRIQGEDEIPPCPLYLHHHEDEAVAAAESFVRADPKKRLGWAPLFERRTDGPAKVVDWRPDAPEEVKRARQGRRMISMVLQYLSLWRRNPRTGEPVAESGGAEGCQAQGVGEPPRSTSFDLPSSGQSTAPPEA